MNGVNIYSNILNMAYRKDVKGRTMNFKPRPDPYTNGSSINIDDGSENRRVLVSLALELKGDELTMYCIHGKPLGRRVDGSLHCEYDDAIEGEDEDGDSIMIDVRRTDKCCTGLSANKAALVDLAHLARTGRTYRVIMLCPGCKDGFYMDQINCYVAQNRPHALVRCSFICPGTDLGNAFVKYEAKHHIKVSTV